MDVTERFTDRAKNYVKCRPSYPTAVLTTLQEACHLTADDVIADVGSGTGLLAQLFLENGNPVFGVEPNEAMRQQGEQFLAGYRNFTSVAATAEATTLPRASVDFVTAGQAGHWFNWQQAMPEFRRILRPGGHVALVWNRIAYAASPFMRQIREAVSTYAVDEPTTHGWGDLPPLEKVLGNEMERCTFAHAQTFNLEGMLGRILSMSFVPLAGHPNHRPLMDTLRTIFARHAQDGRVSFQYRTELYFV